MGRQPAEGKGGELAGPGVADGHPQPVQLHHFDHVAAEDEAGTREDRDCLTHQASFP
jgi:hypothetical protein